jgi:hypothetical protein
MDVYTLLKDYVEDLYDKKLIGGYNIVKDFQRDIHIIIIPLPSEDKIQTNIDTTTT